jgi:drug/metabolite transporter (DMT)-like permease
VSAASTLGGIVLGGAAACCFDGAVALQAVEARAVGDRLIDLLKRPRWLAATGLAIGGWPLQVAALAIAPLTIVQPSLAIGLVLLLFLGARMLGEPVRPRDWVAVGSIAAGLGVLAIVAPENDHVHADALPLALVLGGLAAIALLSRFNGPALVIAAGCGYAASGITTKLLTDAGFTLEGLAWAAGTAAIAGLALLNEMAALQRVGAARVAAGAFALQTAVPVIFAPLLTKEHWSHPAAVIIGLALVVIASAFLGAAAPVAGLIAASEREPEPAGQTPPSRR